MGHRALVAYERTDGTYNIHYSHWGAAGLQLKHRLTTDRPFGGDTVTKWAKRVYKQLTSGVEAGAVSTGLNVDSDPKINTAVDVRPQTAGVTFEEILTDHLDYLLHEAFYVVDSTFDVTAYRTLWFGLQYVCEAIDDQPTIGYGAIRTVRWYEGEPVGDDYTQGHFDGMKHVIGQLVDHGNFDAASAREFLVEQVAATVRDGQELYFGALDR
jgi:hypothetical protein